MEGVPSSQAGDLILKLGLVEAERCWRWSVQGRLRTRPDDGR